MKRFLNHVNFVRENSVFYNELYRDVPKNCEDISKYPIVDQKKFWEENAKYNSGILTSKQKNGIVFKSGGTSGKPKHSYFSNEEWDSFTEVSGRGFRKNGVKEGDRIANLFYAGELYASLIYVSNLIKSANIAINYPIAGQADIAELVLIMEKLQINVIAGVPTTIMNVISYLQEHPEIKLDIHLVLFGGEAFYDDQLHLIAEFFPHTKVHSILYASVDGGELGYFDATNCSNGEHRVFDESTIMEIVDEDTLEVIDEQNKAGKLLVTNLNRKLMPLVRYPTGDMAIWTEKKGTPNRKFKLIGRSQESARLGPATLYIQDIIAVFEYFKDEVHILNFQILLTHEDAKDKATIKIVPQITPKNSDELGKRVIEHIYNERKLLKDLIKNNIIHPIELQWCHTDELQSNTRTGKTKHIIDKRLEA
jgi:phenylacetate-CoA ligase